MPQSAEDRAAIERARRATPEHRAKIATPEYKAKRAADARRYRENEEYRERVKSRHNERYANDPEYREKKKASSRRSNADPIRRQKEKERKQRNALKSRCKRNGITIEQYAEMLAAQGGTCVCGSAEIAAIDHDHSCCAGRYGRCGKCVRGLLCTECNLALGLLHDDPDRLMTLAEYLRRCRSNED